MPGLIFVVTFMKFVCYSTASCSMVTVSVTVYLSEVRCSTDSSSPLDIGRPS